MGHGVRVVDGKMTLHTMFFNYPAEVLEGGRKGVEQYLDKTHPIGRTVKQVTVICSVCVLKEMFVRLLNDGFVKPEEPGVVSYADVASIASMFVFLLFDDDLDMVKETTGIDQDVTKKWREELPLEVFEIGKA